MVGQLYNLQGRGVFQRKTNIEGLSIGDKTEYNGSKLTRRKFELCSP